MQKILEFIEIKEQECSRDEVLLMVALAIILIAWTFIRLSFFQGVN